MRNFSLIPARKIILFFFLWNTSCSKEKRIEFVDFIFVIPITISPIKDNIQMGDTLWVNTSFYDSIYELRTAKKYKIDPYLFDFKTRIGIRSLTYPDLSLNRQQGFSNGFNILNQAGGIYNLGDTFGDLKFIYDNGKYSARVGLQAKSPGIACLSFYSKAISTTSSNQSDLLSFIKLPKSPNGDTRVPLLIDIYYVVNNGNNNFQIFRNNCLSLSELTPIESNIYYEQKGTFTIKVDQ